VPGVLQPVLAAVHSEGSCDMTAELNADADGHDEVDERDGVEGDVPPVHQGPQVDQDQDDAEQDDCGRPEVHAHEEESDHKYCGQGDPQGGQRVLPHRQVLLVKHIEDGVGEDSDPLVLWPAHVDPLGD